MPKYGRPAWLPAPLACGAARSASARSQKQKGSRRPTSTFERAQGKRPEMLDSPFKGALAYPPAAWMLLMPRVARVSEILVGTHAAVRRRSSSTS
eukprot:6194356-Pleurochrysis_carterae.AAC.3